MNILSRLLLGLFSFCLIAIDAGEMHRDAKIYVAGHRGLVGSAIVRRLQEEGFYNIITRTRSELDLTNKEDVNAFFEMIQPEYVFLAAAKVGGIKANQDYPADFIYDNLMIQLNIIDAAHKHDVKKLLFLGSSCIYPRDCPQPIREEYLLTSPLEETNKPYALAKIAGIELCKSYNRQHGTHFISCMPTNLYGPGDNYNLQTSHVFPALIAKFVEAKENDLPSVEVWGSGNARREFLHVDDLAQAVVFLMNQYDGSDTINVGLGEDVSIRELAEMIKAALEYDGEIVWDTSKPDGTPRKLLDISRIKDLGWSPSITLEEGIIRTIGEYYLRRQ